MSSIPTAGPRRAACTLALLAAATLASAHEQAPTYDRVDLGVTAERQVENDTLVITLYAEHQAERQRDAAEQVNAAIAWAIERAAGVPAIEARTLGYRSNPVYRNQALSGWRVRQSLRLESADADVLSTLAGDLQERLAIESILYDVSPDARREAEEALIATAISRFRARANEIAGHFERSGFRIVRVDISTEGGRPPGPAPMRMAAMADAGAGAAPAIEAGTRRLAVQVSGTIELAL